MTSTEKSRAAKQRASEARDREVQEELGDRVRQIQEITKMAQREKITWNQRAKMIAELLGDEEENWMPRGRATTNNQGNIRIVPDPLTGLH